MRRFEPLDQSKDASSKQSAEIRDLKVKVQQQQLFVYRDFQPMAISALSGAITTQQFTKLPHFFISVAEDTRR